MISSIVTLLQRVRDLAHRFEFSAIAQIHDRIVALGSMVNLKTNYAGKTKQLEGILQKIYTTAHDTNDKSILQAIEDVDQDLKKCSTACDRIEKKKKLNKFWSAVTDSNELKELDSLFVHSLQVLNTQLTASNYSTNADRQRDLRHLIRNPQDGFYPLDSTCIYSSVPEIVRTGCLALLIHCYLLQQTKTCSIFFSFLFDHMLLSISSSLGQRLLLLARLTCHWCHGQLYIFSAIYLLVVLLSCIVRL